MTSVLARYRAYDTAVTAVLDKAVEQHGTDVDQWPDEFADQLPLPEWDALPVWLRVGLCLRCRWLDAVYEASPRFGEWLVARRNKERN